MLANLSIHFPVLQVVVPLMAAPACLLLRQRGLAWGFAVLAMLVAFAISVALLYQVIAGGAISYALGGWEAPWGIEYRVDLLNAPLLMLVSGISAIALLAARTSIENEIPADRHTMFYIAWLLCTAGLLGILSTGDAFNVFVFLEISSLSAYTLIALGKDRRALWASYQYLIAGTIGATFILIGIGLMYVMTGTLNMADLAQRLPEVSSSRTVFTAFAFFMVGVCLKLALFPLHLWLPNAYAFAPSVVTAFLAATATKVAVYVLLRFVFSVFGYEFSFSHLPLQEILLVLGLLGIFAASIVAIYQTNLKRLLAYSSVAQIGYLILGISFANETGVMATLLHMLNHGLMKGALFLSLAAVVYRLGIAQLDQMHGLASRMPWTMAAFLIGGLSLIGVPLTVGFVSKWYLVSAALENGWWPVAALILIGSLLSVIYIWKIIEVAYFKPVSATTPDVQEAPLGLLLPMWMLVLANLYFGINTELTVGVSQLAAASLFGGAP
ncbi:MAG: monovalent cation/H+ antiporter subunit D family protein [Gammaproteobacteria bacterium]|nr:monovalent cation/H+ antiporter subunit D family protein [Gammaproteobacteria bacterium]MDP2139601.1 monovalent cation/H+ antiporter subunit D family protein [Gammaproteobacteria bacterium]MDP2346574.1 monovalent cation/H+ antiporter subunit D family protein [Gammaproteobacteria bacterium]